MYPLNLKSVAFPISEIIGIGPTRKLKHANSILEYFEYFCQISTKLINVILSYRPTVSKLLRFFETQCISVKE